MSTYLNESFFLILFALNVSLISLFLLAKLRRVQVELQNVKQLLSSDRERTGRNLNSLLVRLQVSEQKIDSTCAAQAELKVDKSMDTNLSQANKLLDLGLCSEELVSSFGLSEAEARLMSLVHTKSEKTSAAA
ncbi:MAG: DUF2802 domain-containing protein [Pseudohongiellaceae bacterium]